MKSLLRLVACIALAAGNFRHAAAEEADTARLYLRIPLNGGLADVSDGRLGLSLSYQSDAAATDFGVDGLNLVNFEFSAEGVEKAAFAGIDAAATYDLLYGETGRDLADQGVTQGALMFYVVTAGVAGGLLAACAVDWCRDQKKTVVVVHKTSTPTNTTPAPVVVVPTSPSTPVTPSPPVTPPVVTNPVTPPPVTPVTPVVSAFTGEALKQKKHPPLKWSDLMFWGR